jgi:hypothetical protein
MQSIRRWSAHAKPRTPTRKSTARFVECSYGFPYGLFFVASTKEIKVYGCFHGARDPALWKRRIDA